MLDYKDGMLPLSPARVRIQSVLALGQCRATHLASDCLVTGFRLGERFAFGMQRKFTEDLASLVRADGERAVVRAALELERGRAARGTVRLVLPHAEHVRFSLDRADGIF
ncbi:hypothetical protein PWR05_35315 [Paraburkholderia sp. A2RI-6]|uniref:hypothetical protein n=1 Tax=Paraburkholderia sp. A2RI-6 TaxID=3028371 RepID=UPI003B7C9864